MSTASSISGAIKWTGLASGTDFKSVVEKLVAIEQRTVTRQKVWQSEWQLKLDAINGLDARLVALKLNAQDYDTRDKFLTRAATSAKPEVATITNTSTAATGVYSVEVGDKIVEKVGSKTYNDAAHIGNIIPATSPDDPAIIQKVTDWALANSVSFSGAVTFNSVTNQYEDEDATPIVLGSFDGTDVIASDGITILAQLDSGVFKDTASTIIPTQDPALLPPSLTITMGGKTLTLDYTSTFPADVDNALGVYHQDMTMAQLAKVINNTVAGATPGGGGLNDDPPNITASILYDKTRGTGADNTYSRLVITGGEGGQGNHITVSDPTNLGLDRNSIDDPVMTSWVGSEPKVSVDPSSAYTGHVNKTITVVTTQYTGDGVLGTDDIKFNWADTEGNTGNFIIRAADWDTSANKLINPIELLQGVKISFAGSGGNHMIKNEAFSIDCQSPVMQKASDIGLAQTDKWVHQGLSSLTTPVTFGAAGVFAYSYAGKNYSLTVPDGLGLSGLVDRINSDSNNPGVIASILNDGMGTATSYKLVLSGHKEGAENGIRILETTSLNRMPAGPDTWDHAREASNSMSRIDGYPNDGVSWIQRPTNEVGDVLDGVVVTLQGPGVSQITVQNNVTAMKDKIKELINSVNFVKEDIKNKTRFNSNLISQWNETTQMFERVTESGKEASGVMIGNYGFQMAQTTIDRLVTKEIFTRDEYIKAIDPEGNKGYSKLPKTVADEDRDGPSQEGLYRKYLDKHGLVYTRLSDIGIASNPDPNGKDAAVYIIEESKLTEALTRNPEAVIKLLTFRPDEVEDPPMSMIKPMEDEDARPRIAGFAVNMGYALSDLTRTTDVIDANTGEISKRAKGITKVLAENYINIISGIDVKIAREDKRIEMVRTRLESKFNRLEVLLASLNDQSTSVQAQLDNLSNSSK
ncbi:MAG: flagellar filament capping protein FliD [Candidatus Adiutrix sp.]|jgi:flagellar hook-associated protein 2|nr:flagellar filament capping protein FliD [Candidatus Adiutrix sp.]